MPDDQPETPVDPRAAAALERLRHDPPPAGGLLSRELLERSGWGDRALAALARRWPALDDRPVVVGLAVLATVAVLVAVGVWILGTGTAGPNDGPDGGFRLPFTTTTGGPLPAGGPGGGSPSGTAVPTTATALVVHAAGAVVTPGVHRVPNGARVADVLAAAGGATDAADLERLNLAAPVSDGQRVYVPRVGEVVPPAVLSPEGSSGSGTAAGKGPPAPVDLNQATEAELDVLPGVGPSTAAAIVAHRVANGPFRTVDDLLEVRGIGPAKLEAMRDLVRVG